MFKGGLLKLLVILVASTTVANANYYRPMELPSSLKEKVIGVRVQDFARFTDVIPGLKKEGNELEKKWNNFVENEYDLDETLNIFFRDYPMLVQGGYALPITAFGKLEESGHMAFVEATAFFDGNDFSVAVENVILLGETLFSLEVSLVNRKLILTDAMSPVKMVFPLGVGAFDEKVLNDEVTILTPRFENGFLDQWTAISERKKPRYFAGKPFLRITTTENPANGHTAIGFHAQPNLDEFIRAFDSHGCMRMQTNDLQMLHDLLKKGPHRRLSINVKFNIDDEADTPFPKRNKPYKKVLNVGSKSAPDYKLDRDRLVQTTNDWENSAPISLLEDRDGDTHQRMFNYDTAWREKEKREKRRQECAEDYPWQLEEKSRDQRKMKNEFEDCVQSGRRRLSLRDRAYRWWVH